MDYLSDVLNRSVFFSEQWVSWAERGNRTCVAKALRRENLRSPAKPCLARSPYPLFSPFSPYQFAGTQCFPGITDYRSPVPQLKKPPGFPDHFSAAAAEGRKDGFRVEGMAEIVRVVDPVPGQREKAFAFQHETPD